MKQILVFVLMASLLCWLMFSPIYKHVLIVRQAVLQKEVDLILEIGTNASYGFIHEGMIQESKQRLADNGFVISELVYTVQATNGYSATNPHDPVPRGEGIVLHVSYPYQNLLQIDALIGVLPPSSDSRISAGGMKMSEYVP